MGWVEESTKSAHKCLDELLEKNEGVGVTEAREIVRHLTEVVITPAHAERKESSEFGHSKER